MKPLVRENLSTNLSLNRPFILLFLNRALFSSEKMNQALAKTALAEQKLASVGKLEEENAKLKTALDEANKEATRLKKDKNNLNEKMEGIARKRDDLENYLGGLAKKLFVMLEGIFFEPTDLSLSTRYNHCLIFELYL